MKKLVKKFTTLIKCIEVTDTLYTYYIPENNKYSLICCKPIFAAVENSYRRSIADSVVEMLLEKRLDEERAVILSLARQSKVGCFSFVKSLF